MNLRKKLIQLFITFAISFGVFINATAAFSLDEPLPGPLPPTGNVPDFFINHEVGASIIANYISNGLIPQGEIIGYKVIYPNTNIDSKKTEEIFTNNDNKTIYEKITPEQRVDLFINMLCDMVLLNPDTHPKHFGITQDGYLISFNKGYAYASIFALKNTFEFNTPDDFLSESKIYKDFVQELKKHPEELEKLLNDPRVKEAFLRISTLTTLQTERESVKQILMPLFTFIKQQASVNNNEEQVIKDFFKMLTNISEFLAEELASKEYFAEAVTIKSIKVDNDVNEMKVLTFNPKVNKMFIVAAKEHGFSEGERVDTIAKNANAFAAMNGGFFNEGARSSTWLGNTVGRLYKYAYDYTGWSIGTNYAFPSAIQKINNKLLSDTSNYLPALGISASGDIKFGEVKVIWSAKLSENGKKFILDRRSDIDSNSTDAVIDYQDSTGIIKEVSISNGQVSNIKTVTITEITKDTPNCYWLHEPSKETIDEFNSLKVGDPLSYDYELGAAAYPELTSIATMCSAPEKTKDTELTAFFNECPHVVSGGQLLIHDGDTDLRISDDYGRAIGTYKKIGTAVCLRKDGMVSLIAKKDDLPSNDFVALLKKEECKYAMSLDGGGSTTLTTKEDLNNGKFYGYNRVVSDIVAVMPRYSNILLSDWVNRPRA